MNRVFFRGIKGGTGTTSIVANIATLLAQSKHNVLCIDLDPKNELCLHLGHHWLDQIGWSNKINDSNSQWTDVAFVNEDSVKYVPYGSETTNSFSLNTLLNQEWIIEPKKKVKYVLKKIAGKDKIKIIKFVRFKVGEGI